MYTEVTLVACRHKRVILCIDVIGFWDSALIFRGDLFVGSELCGLHTIAMKVIILY